MGNSFYAFNRRSSECIHYLLYIIDKVKQHVAHDPTLFLNALIQLTVNNSLFLITNIRTCICATFGASVLKNSILPATDQLNGLLVST